MKVIKESIIHPKPSEELLRKEEGLWRIKLPQKYTEFIKENNGCMIENNTFKGKHKEYAIDRFLALTENTEENSVGMYDIDVVLAQIEERLTSNEDLIGVEVLPFAQLFAGDYLCLDFRKSSETPSVCIWSHEESKELEPMFYAISDSFEKFINTLE